MVVLAASWIVAVNVATACSMRSGVFNGMLQFILLSIISLKVCHLVVLLHYYGCMIGAKLEVGCYF